MSEPTPEPEPAAAPPSTAVEPPLPPQVEPPPTRWRAPSPIVEVPGAPGLVFADVGSRLVAYLVDSLIVGITGAIVIIAFGWGEIVGNSTSRYMWVSGWTADIAFAVLGALYFVFFWTGGRRSTIGQRLFDIQVGNAFDGRPLTLDQALRRWLGYGTFLGLFAIVASLRGIDTLAQLLWILVLLASTARSRFKQGLHDRFAGSAVVRPGNRASGGPAMTCLIVVIVLAVAFVAAILALIYLGAQIHTFAPPSGTPV